MKLILMIVGVILILMGGIWILQGFNILPVGFMAGQMQYALLGAILMIAGVGLLAFSRRRRKAVPVSNDNTQEH
jgi:LPXTG-motif cell wall-anchored protein